MEHFSATVEEETVEVSNVVMIEDEVTDVKTYSVMVTSPKEDEDFLTGDVLFEAQFEFSDDADAFYELMQKAELKNIG